jgi:hypothetical protein
LGGSFCSLHPPMQLPVVRGLLSTPFSPSIYQGNNQLFNL